MASVFKKSKSKGAPYYIDYFDEHRKRCRVKGCADKGASERIARKLESEVALRRRGVISARDDALAAHAGRPLAEHLDAWHARLTADGDTPKHAALSLDRARRVVGLVMGAALADIDAPKATKRKARKAFGDRLAAAIAPARLADLTADRVQEALATLKAAGRSLQTCNHHRTAIRGFSRWAWKVGRTADDALVGVAGFNVQTDRRHDRRTISVEELQRLIDAAHNGPTYQQMTGPARALVYRLAVATGLRYSELSSIRPESFDLSGDRPTVTVTAGYTKNGDPATLPIPSDLAADLPPFLATVPAGSPVFPLPEKGAKMIRADLARAKISYRDAAGLVFDFHALRCQCATLADAAGVSPRVVQRLMRHSTLELTGRYTRPRAHDIDAAASALPSLRPSSHDPEALAATGTDPPPVAGATRGATQAAIDARTALAPNDLASGRQRTHKPQVTGSNPVAATIARNRQFPPRGVKSCPKQGVAIDRRLGA
jgi:integrase